MNLINDQEEQEVAEQKSLRNEETHQTCIILNDH